MRAFSDVSIFQALGHLGDQSATCVGGQEKQQVRPQLILALSLLPHVVWSILAGRKKKKKYVREAGAWVLTDKTEGQPGGVMSLSRNKTGL